MAVGCGTSTRRYFYPLVAGKGRWGLGKKSYMWLYRLPLWLGELQDYDTQAEFSAGILEHSLWARNRIGIGLSYRLASAGIFK